MNYFYSFPHRTVWTCTSTGSASWDGIVHSVRAARSLLKNWTFRGYRRYWWSTSNDSTPTRMRCLRCIKRSRTMSNFRWPIWTCRLTLHLRRRHAITSWNLAGITCTVYRTTTDRWKVATTRRFVGISYIISKKSWSSHVELLLNCWFCLVPGGTNTTITPCLASTNRMCVPVPRIYYSIPFYLSETHRICKYDRNNVFSMFVPFLTSFSQ